MSSARISPEPLTSTVGARVGGIDLTKIDDDDAGDIRSTLTEFGVLVFPDQSMSADQQVVFASRFGRPHGHPVMEFLTGNPDDPVSLVENDAGKPPQEEQSFHTDYSFNTVVPDLAILRAEVIPPKGGDTVWSSTHAAYDALSNPMKAFIGGLVALHEPSHRFWFEYARTVGPEAVQRAQEAFPGAHHPVVARHPLSGRPLLYVNAGYTTRVTGVTLRESRALLDLLFAQHMDPAFHYRHKWSDGDVVMWDEHGTVHMGPHDFYPAHRRLTRVTSGHRAPEAASTPAA
jgi:taurine dioxygenase